MLCTAFAGIFTGILFDLLSVTDRLFGENRVIVFLKDFFTVVAGYLLMFICALHFNNGILRWYHPVLAFAGLRLYRRLFSKTVLRLIHFLYTVIEKVLRFIIGVLMKPAAGAARICVRLYRAYLKRRARRKQENSYQKEKRKFTSCASAGFHLAAQ